VSNLLMTTCFQDIHEADQIRIDVGLRIRQGVPHTGLSGQVNDSIEAMSFKQSIDAVTIFQSQLLKVESGTTFQKSESIMFEPGLIIVVQIVEADHGVASIQQASGRVHPDETRCSGNQNIRHTR
jgi:hypothetical protein